MIPFLRAHQPQSRGEGGGRGWGETGKRPFSVSLIRSRSPMCAYTLRSRSFWIDDIRSKKCLLSFGGQAAMTMESAARDEDVNEFPRSAWRHRLSVAAQRRSIQTVARRRWYRLHYFLLHVAAAAAAAVGMALVRVPVKRCRIWKWFIQCRKILHSIYTEAFDLYM